METCPHCKKQFNYSPIYHGIGPNDYGDYSCYDCLSERDKAAYDAFFRASGSEEKACESEQKDDGERPTVADMLW